MSIYDPPCPPDPPQYIPCDKCNAPTDTDDLTTCGRRDEICPDCITEIVNEVGGNDQALRDKVYQIVRKHGVYTPDEIAEYLSDNRIESIRKYAVEGLRP